MTHNTISPAALAEGQLMGALFQIRDEYVIAHELVFASPISRVLRFGFRKRPPVSSLAASLDDQLRALDTLLPRLASLTLSPARLEEAEEYFQGLRKAIAALRTLLGVALRRGRLSHRSSVEAQMYLIAAAEFGRQSDRARGPKVSNSESEPAASLAPVIAVPVPALPRVPQQALEAALPNVAAQAALIKNVRTQILAFDEKFGRHRNGMVDATADFFNALERLSSEAGNLKLDEVPKRHLAILAGQRNRYLPKADLYNPGVEFDGFQHPLAPKAIRRISIISARAAGTPLSALQAEFYERAIATLTRLKELINKRLHGDRVVESLKEQTAEEFMQRISAVGILVFEAEALEIEDAVLHGLHQLSNADEGLSSHKLSRLLVLLARTARRLSNTADSTEA